VLEDVKNENGGRLAAKQDSEGKGREKSTHLPDQVLRQEQVAQLQIRSKNKREENRKLLFIHFLERVALRIGIG